MRFELLCVLLFAVGSNGLQCYVCDSDNEGDGDCASSTATDLARFEQTCEDGKDYCRRNEYKGRIVRVCSDSGVNTIPICNSDDECISTGSCNTDKCNHGNGFYMINHFIALIGLCLAFFLTR